MQKLPDEVLTHAQDLLARDTNIDHLAGELLTLCAENVGHTALFYLTGEDLVGWRSCSGGQFSDISSWRIPTQASALYRKLLEERLPAVCEPPELGASSGGEEEMSALTGGATSICLVPLIIGDRPAGVLLFGSESAFSDEAAAALKNVINLFASRVEVLHETEASPTTGRTGDPPGTTTRKVLAKEVEENIRRVLSKIETLPAMPGIAGKVLEMVEGADTGAKDLQRIISNDPALTARILRVANSSYYCCGMDVNTLSEAVVILGFNTLRSLVVAASVRSLYVQKPVRGADSGKGTARFKSRQKSLWEHSVACAAISRTIAKKTGLEKPETAFVTGLLHDIGRLVICRQMPEEYERWLSQKEAVLDGSAGRSDSPGAAVLESECDVFSFDHCQVGAAVAGKWRLSRDMVEVISNHHSDENDPPPSQLAAIVDFSNLICMKNNIGTLSCPDINLKEHRDRLNIPLTDDDLDGVLEDLGRILAAESIFI